MAKKYSFQMENDEIVSLEVDGVSYTKPDDIPDKKDRKKIKALISRTRGADSDDDFDKAFDQETREAFREMERQSAIFPKLILAIFLGVAVITLVIAAFSAYSAVQTISREKSAPGRVVDLVVRTSRDSTTGEVTSYTYPVVEFVLPGRQLQKVQMSEGSSPPDYEVGDQVTVLYNPQRPRDSRIKSFTSDLMLWLLPGITFLVGAAFVTAAVVVFKFWPPNGKETVST
jgi:hypothetical protein